MFFFLFFSLLLGRMDVFVGEREEGEYKGKKFVNPKGICRAPYVILRYREMALILFL